MHFGEGASCCLRGNSEVFVRLSDQSNVENPDNWDHLGFRNLLRSTCLKSRRRQHFASEICIALKGDERTERMSSQGKRARQQLLKSGPKKSRGNVRDGKGQCERGSIIRRHMSTDPKTYCRGTCNCQEKALTGSSVSYKFSRVLSGMGVAALF